MIPFGLTEKQFIIKYRKCLDKSARFFINELCQLFTKKIPQTVSHAEVEIFLNDDNDAVISDAVIYYLGENNKVDQSDQAIFAGRVINLPFCIEKIALFDPKYFDEKFFDGKNLIADTFKMWFAECWWKAGGWTYSIPVKLHVHDDFGDGTIINLTEKEFKGK